MNRPDHGTRNNGYVLLSVLSVLALLSGLVVAMLLLTRNAIDTAVIASNDLTADAMTQSAISLAGYQLFILKHPVDRVNGQQIRLNQGVISLSVSSDAGKVDLNGSGKDLLAAAYQASGLRTMTPQVFAARVIDWRDSNVDVADDGAELPEYQAAALTYGPRNSSFRSIDDLQWVLGITTTEVEALKPFVTIYNPAGRLNVFSTAEPLLATLPGVDEEIAGQILALQAVRNDLSIAKLDDLLLVQAALIDSTPPRTYRVRIDLQLARDGPPRRSEVVLAAGVTEHMPYQILNRSKW